MSTTIVVRPRGLCWSRNPIHHIFQHAYAPAGARFVLELQDALFGGTLTQVQYPIKSIAFTDNSPYLEDLMDPLLSYVRPGYLTPGAGAAVPEEMWTNIKGFKVRYAEAAPGAVPSFTQDSFITKAIKGGLGDMNFIGAAIVNDGGHATPITLPANGRFLTHVPKMRLQRPDEWGWLLYLCTDNYPRTADYEVHYLDNSITYFSKLLPASGVSDYASRNWYLPTGISQCALDPTNKGVKYLRIGVSKNTNPGGSPTFIYEGDYLINIDNRPYYHPFTLYYRNSLGGWDNITLRGEIEHSADAERGEWARDINHSQNGMAGWYNASIRPKWKGFTGYMSAEHMTALQDMLLSTECALLSAGQWLPVRVTTKTLIHYSTKNSLHSSPIELEAAGSFTSFPKQLMTLR